MAPAILCPLYRTIPVTTPSEAHSSHPGQVYVYKWKNTNPTVST